MSLFSHYDDSSDEEEVELTVGVKRTNPDSSSTPAVPSADNLEKKMRGADNRALPVPEKADITTQTRRSGPRSAAFDDVGIVATSKATRRAGNAFFKLQQDNRQIRMKTVDGQSEPSVKSSSSGGNVPHTSDDKQRGIGAPVAQADSDSTEPLPKKIEDTTAKEPGHALKESVPQSVSSPEAKESSTTPDQTQQEAYAKYMEQYAAAYKQYMESQGVKVPPGTHMPVGPTPPHPYPYPHMYPHGYYPPPYAYGAQPSPQEETAALLANAPASFGRLRKQTPDSDPSVSDLHAQATSQLQSSNITEVRASNLRGGGWDTQIAAAVEAAQQATQAKRNAPTIRGKTWNAESGSVVSVSAASRLHKGKNQIHVLAQQAAANALAIQDTKARGEKTKRQVWAKYGW